MLKILIWGTGLCAEEFYFDIIKKEEINIIGFIESTKSKDALYEIPVFDLNEITHLSYDFLVVASTYVNEIREKIIELEIPEKKIVFLRYSHQISDNLFYQTERIEKVIPGFSNKYCRDYGEKKIVIKDSYDLSDEYIEDYKIDYIRYKMFDLVRKYINDDMPGDVAELGVYRGVFAKHINRKFPNRTLYLFDTFEGFREEESKKELKKGNCDDTFIDYYRNGSEDETLKKMKYKDSVVIKKGLFPESLQGLETQFVFVSIDVDFEDSIYAGLEYFYPRTVVGGYLFVHDYNSQLKGVKAAVERFEKRYGKIRKIEIPDNCGTLIIIK